MKSASEICCELINLSNQLFVPENRHLIKEFMAKIHDLKKVFSGSEGEKMLVQKIQNRLVVPLMMHLQAPAKSDFKMELIETLEKVLNMTIISDIRHFFDVYTSVFFQIYKPDDESVNHAFSEEIKSCVLKCAIALINSTKKDILSSIYSQREAEKLSLGILIAIKIAAEEKSHSLRLDALNFILAVSQYCNVTIEDSELWRKIGDVFMLFLPGLIGPLQEIILRDETQPHAITANALTCWGHVLLLVMQDQKAEDNFSDEKLLQFWMNLSKDETFKKSVSLNMSKTLQEKQRTKEWFEAAAVTLKPLIFKITDAKKHSHPKVRYELTRVMNDLLKNCTLNLKIAVTPMVEVLVSSIEDEDEDVKNLAEFSICDFEERCNEKQGRIFGDVIQENLYVLINKMPGLIYSGDEKAIFSSLKVLTGYLKILSRCGKLTRVINSLSSLRRLITVIMICSQLEIYPEISRRGYSLQDADAESSEWTRPWQQFKHFTDQSISNKIRELCNILGKHGEIEIIIDYLMDTYSNNFETRKEVLFIINDVVFGSDNLPNNLINSLLELYLDPENLYLPLEVDEEKCFSVREAHDNILKVVLLMEGIGKLATSISNKFQEYLLKSLYYVIEKMGSSFVLIKTAATVAAEQIATATNLNGSVKALMQNNVDYLTYHLTTKLKRIERNSGVLDVVTVLMKNSPVEAVSNLEEIIIMVLRACAQKFESPHTKSYLRLFQTFVLCVNKWIGDDARKPENRSEPTGFDLADSLREYVESKNRQKKNPDDEETNPEEENEEETNRESAKRPENLPRHITMTLSIARHCLNYLPSNDVDKKLIVLEILTESVVILSEYEDELLPIVHEIWSPLVTRFEKISDPLIINRSFMLLCTLSEVSKDFIRSRTLKEVLPTLRNYLLKSADKSKLKDSGSGYYFTQGYKLQKTLLDKLGKLVVDLKLFERETDYVVECCLPYLSNLQPQPLQESCRKLFLELKQHDPYLIWLRLHVLLDRREFCKNSSLILKELT